MKIITVLGLLILVTSAIFILNFTSTGSSTGAVVSDVVTVKEYVCSDGQIVLDPIECPKTTDVTTDVKKYAWHRMLSPGTEQNCLMTTYNSYTSACYDNRGEEPYLSSEYCDDDIIVIKQYECINDFCEPYTRRIDCAKTGHNCVKSDNPSKDRFVTTCERK